jgi:hypothetical protein
MVLILILINNKNASIELQNISEQLCTRQVNFSSITQQYIVSSSYICSCLITTKGTCPTQMSHERPTYTKISVTKIKR